jgi:hypothetical protein
MNFVYLIIIVFAILFIIDKLRKSNNREFDKKYFIKSLFKIFLGVGILFAGIGIFLYYQLTADIEEEFEKVFDTPIEKISDLEGYGGGFQDFYLQLCFKSKDNVVLKDEEKYISLKDSSNKVDMIKEFKIKFADDRYEDHNRDLIDLNPNDVEIKRYEYKVHDLKCYKIILSIKSKNIHFYKAN